MKFEKPILIRLEVKKAPKSAIEAEGPDGCDGSSWSGSCCFKG